MPIRSFGSSPHDGVDCLPSMLKKCSKPSTGLNSRRRMTVNAVFRRAARTYMARVMRAWSSR